MAERMFISRSNVSKLENNKLELKARDLIRWCKETNGQDMLIAVTCGIDPAMIADIGPNAIDGMNNLIDLLTNITPGLINLLGVIL